MGPSTGCTVSGFEMIAGVQLKRTCDLRPPGHTFALPMAFLSVSCKNLYKFPQHGISILIEMVVVLLRGCIRLDWLLKTFCS